MKGSAHLRSASHSSALQTVRCWDTACLFMARLQPLLLGMSCHIIDIQAQLGSAILGRMTFFDLYDVNFDTLWHIMDTVFQPKHGSGESDKPPKHMYSSLQYTVDFGLLYSHYVLIDFELVKVVHTDCHVLKHFTCRCRRWILLDLGWLKNLSFIGMHMQPLITVNW